MKKIIAFILCVSMLASMAVVASAASIVLPDGGSRKNTGCATVYGYTDGGTDDKTYMTCTIRIADASTGKVVSQISSSKGGMGTGAYITVVAWQDAAHQYNLASNHGRSPASTAKAFSLTVYGGAATASGTAGYEYSSTQYGDWNCGTTTN